MIPHFCYRVTLAVLPGQYWVQGDFRRAEKNQALLKAVRAAVEAAGAPEQPDDLVGWFQQTSLDRLTAEQNDALRRQVARAILTATDPAADPPQELIDALGWPHGRRRELATLLTALRAQLSGLADWQAPIEYADRAEGLGLLRATLARIAELDRLVIHTPAGDALRDAVVKAGLTAEAAADIETRYRDDLVRELQWHDFRGIAQVKKNTRIPLSDVYLELGLLRLRDPREQQRLQERLLTLDEAERAAAEERRLDERVTDALTEFPRLVILGGPGAGKTISLRFIALMLAHGSGAARLGLDAPYLPLMVRLADYARELEKDGTLSLANYLLDYVGKAYDTDPQLPKLLRLALEKGVCMLLLDGLDEVGGDPRQGRPLRTAVVKQVQKFADIWCCEDRCNRVVVTSRIEGYDDEPVRDFGHVQLSPLRPPDEIEAFLLRWYAAHERAHETPDDLAEQRARERVGELLPSILAWESVRRLATNPLLLTILALIYENVGKLPNRRIELYESCAQTLIESWRQAQTGAPGAWPAELSGKAVIGVMAPLAYWLHEENPGGTASFDDWRAQLTAVLQQKGHETEAERIAESFLHHARHEAGLLSERGLEQYGFFHLTFEEYLAAREIARQRVEQRRELLRLHWEDPRWHEVILLAAGQLGIMEAREDEVSDLVKDLLEMQAEDPANAGRQVVLAGRALADIGADSVTPKTRRWVIQDLEQTMQDLDPDSGQPHDPPLLPVRTRYDAGEVLDELGWLPNDLDSWVLCPGCARDGGDLLVMKYPLTNAQFERFVEADGYKNPEWWSEAGWQWRVKDHPSYRGEGAVTEPLYWRDARFGRERRGYPVVGVSWYEAEAYCLWLGGQLRAVPLWRNGRLETWECGGLAVRLPDEAEWEAFAGGVRVENRYPWDPPDGPATTDAQAILARANTEEAELGGPSPVGMYPLGASQPFGLFDLAGNVWEWTTSEHESWKGSRVLRGGAWVWEQGRVRCAARSSSYPDNSSSSDGFRCVSPVSRSGF